MKGIIILLGSPNDDKGKLLSIAEERANQAIIEINKNPDYKILPTGGFGKHFNTTKLPHAHYAKQYLLSQGIPETDILEFAISSNTIEDAKYSKPIVDKKLIQRINIVTSDFHIERARIIFEKEFSNYALSFTGSVTNLAAEQLDKFRSHEKQAINHLLKN